jgi:hypothetical protein
MGMVFTSLFYFGLGFLMTMGIGFFGIYLKARLFHKWEFKLHQHKIWKIQGMPFIATTREYFDNYPTYDVDNIKIGLKISEKLNKDVIRDFVVNDNKICFKSISLGEQKNYKIFIHSPPTPEIKREAYFEQMCIYADKYMKWLENNSQEKE